MNAFAPFGITSLSGWPASNPSSSSFVSVSRWELCDFSRDPSCRIVILMKRKKRLYDDTNFYHRDLILIFKQQHRVKIWCDRKCLDAITFDRRWVQAANMVVRKFGNVGVFLSSPSYAWHLRIGSFGTSPPVSRSFLTPTSLVSCILWAIVPVIYWLGSNIFPTPILFRTYHSIQSHILNVLDFLYYIFIPITHISLPHYTLPRFSFVPLV